MEEEKGKLDKLKKGIGVGILAGALGLGNVSGADDKPLFDNNEGGTKIETSIQNSILTNKGIKLQFEEDVYYPDGKMPPREFFEKHINKMTVDDSLKPVLVDILMRRSSEYVLSKKDIKRDINRLINNVDEIIVDDNRNKDWNGSQSYYEKTIRLGTSFKGDIEKLKKHKELNTDFYNSDNYEKAYNSLFEVLTHEVYHALTYEPENDESDLDGNDREKNHSLHEVLVEKAADRAVMNTSSIKGHHLPFEFAGNTYGYTNSTFIVDIIEATYGISEKELLSNVIKGGRKELIKTLAKIGKEKQEDVVKFLNDLQEPFNMQFNTHYNEYNNNSKEQKIEDIKISMSNIYMVSLNKMNNLIYNRKINNIKDAKEYTEDLKYNYYKLNYVMKNSLINEREHWGESIDLDSKIIKDRSELENRIYNMNEIIRNASEFGSNDQIMELFNQAKNNQISPEKINEINEKYQKRIHITDFKDWEHISFDTLYGYRETEAKENYIKDDWRGNKWDNKEINQKMQQSYEKLYNEHQKEGFFRKVRRSVKGLYEFGKSKTSYSFKKVIDAFSNFHNKLTGKKETLMLNSGQEREEFINRIKIETNKEKEIPNNTDKIQKNLNNDELER